MCIDIIFRVWGHELFCGVLSGNSSQRPRDRCDPTSIHPVNLLSFSSGCFDGVSIRRSVPLLFCGDCAACTAIMLNVQGQGTYLIIASQA